MTHVTSIVLTLKKWQGEIYLWPKRIICILIPVNQANWQLSINNLIGLACGGLYLKEKVRNVWGLGYKPIGMAWQ